MAAEWRDITLEDVADELTVGYVGPMAHEYVDDGIPFLRSQNVEPLRINKSDLKFITPAFHQRIQKSRLRPGDVVIVRTGKPGACSVVPEWLAEANCSDLVIVRCGSELNNRFLAYYINTVASGHVSAHLVGAVQQHFNVGSARTLRLNLPPLPEQKAIASILGALDDKIELNRRMNATLEAMARALFQSWFIDFDPVRQNMDRNQPSPKPSPTGRGRSEAEGEGASGIDFDPARAKIDGRQPTGLDRETAALFPNAFHKSEAGHIPKGWTVGKVSDLATLNRGAVNPGDFPTEIFNHYSLPAFDNGRTPKVELGSAIMSNKFIVTPNSVLLSKLNPHIPRIWLPDLHASRRSVCSTEFMVACSKPGVSREYLFSLFTGSAFASVYGTLVTGTTGSHQRIRPESVLDMKTVIPFATLILAFTDIAKPMFDRINRNTEQSRTLAALRDALLPKLLSGELSVAPTSPTTK